MQCKLRFSPVRRAVIWFAGTEATVDLCCVAGGHCLLGIGLEVAAAPQESGHETQESILI